MHRTLMAYSFWFIFVSLVANQVETVVEKENQEAPAVAADAAATATSGAVVEEEAVAAPATTTTKEHKDNVIDTIKKGPLGKLFKKDKKEDQPAATEAADTAEVAATEPAAEATATADEPAAAESAGKFNNPSTHLFAFETMNGSTCEYV
ncbi:hypothetical protein BD408DRAFT_199079 [Parasitella parasitica]|nr:hypothetical protein BD408DRAFT_199079 [Parasitella parasitica]